MAFKFGGASYKNLEGVHPHLVRVVKRALSLSAVDFKVICGTRTVAEQRVLLKAGKSRTMNSRHIPGKDGWGKAVDLLPLPVNWNNWEPFKEVARAMKAAAKLEGVEIEWGGDWKGFVDGPHFQLPHSKYP
jgi:peptidoglycan L-alanyl-D-glutamate endopeptidase CwlK